MSGSLDKQRKAFKADPDNTRAFEALEEHYFLQGEWRLLVGIYRHRLCSQAMRDDSRLAAPLVFRLAQVVEDRLGDGELAHEHYKHCARLDPAYRPALERLRSIHAEKGQWDVVLQIAEVESESEMRPEERAEFLAEMGDIWLQHLDDPAEALGHFRGSLEIDATHHVALTGLARAHERMRNHAEAGQAWEKVIAQSVGIERAQPLVALGHLLAGPLADPTRAMECFRRALSDDPRNEEAVCALVIEATADEQWSLLPELYDRRFDVAMGAKRRSTVAIEAGHLHLDRFDDVDTARRWFEKARELRPDDLAVHHSLAEVARRTEDTAQLIDSLDHIIAASGNPPPSILLEAADAHSSRGNAERALVLLTRARDHSPENPLVLDALCDTLADLNRSAELCEILEQRAQLASEDSELCASIYSELGRRQRDDLSDLEAARRAYQQAFDAAPQLHGSGAELAELLRKAEAWDELEAHLERARIEGSACDRPGFHCALGELLLERREDCPRASEAFEAALVLDPENPRALRGLLQCSLASGDEDAQIRVYEREVRATSDDERRALAACELARLLEARNRIPEAIHWLETLDGRCPPDRDTLETMARLAALPAEGGPSGVPGDPERLVAALERLDEVIARDEPDAFDVLGLNRQRIAALHAAANRPERAIEWYEASLRAEPDNTDALLALRDYYDPETKADDRIRIERSLADALPEEDAATSLATLASLLEERSGDFDGAIDALKRLLAMPGRHDSRDFAAGLPRASYEDQLEKLLERTGRFDALADWLDSRRAAQADGPESRELDLRRARILLERLERAGESAELFRAVLSEEPENTRAAEGLERAIRTQGDPAALAALLAQLTATASDAQRRDALAFERAGLLEARLNDPIGALSAYRGVLDSGASRELADAAIPHIDELLAQTGDFVGLRRFLAEQLARTDAGHSAEQVRTLHERLAALCRDRLNDTDGCLSHWEAVARDAPTDDRPWRELATLYTDLDRPDDLLRATSALLNCEPTASEELSLRHRALALWLDRESPQGDLEAIAHGERILALDPGHGEAAELLCAHYERAGLPAETVRVLEARLRSLSERDENDSNSYHDNRAPHALARAALRLRISRLRSDALGDLDGAIEVLEPSLEDEALLVAVAEPLAALYETAGRSEPLAHLCRRSAEKAGDDSSRIRWQLRLARALLADRAESDRSESAVRVYEEVLQARPQEPEARASLRELYRDRGDHEPLARLLERELSLAPASELQTLEELAPLLEHPLGRPEAALPHWLRILEVAPTRDEAFEHAMSLSRDLAAHETQLSVIEQRLQLDLAGERTMLLELRGDLLARELDRPEEALAEYRQALDAPQEQSSASQSGDTPRGRVRRSLRAALERLGLWPAFLESIEDELSDPAATSDERSAALYRAAEVSFDHIGPDAALPWLERLRAQRPEDRDVVARIAALHRAAGRHHSLLNALEEELALLPANDVSRRRELRLERAQLFERELGSVVAAVEELEALRGIGLHDTPEILSDLERLYATLGRDREHCEILEARLAQSDDANRRAQAACLASGSLDDPDRAIVHWLHALHLTDDGDPRRIEWLIALASDLERAGRFDAWTQAVEARLTAEDLREQVSLSQHERASLEADLADVYADQLGRSQSAARHWRAALALLASAGTDPLRDRVECALISQLREEGSALELEDCLHGRLTRGAGNADEWLELARLRLETLAAPSAASDAFREVLRLEPCSRAALGGLRRAAESTSDWASVALTLEWELERIADLAPEHRAGMARRLGELHWHKLNQRQEAATAFAAALDAVPGDLQTLRAYAQLCEENEQWFEAVSLLEDQIRSLGESDAERRQSLWLHIARLSRDRCEDSQCAVQSYREASQLAPLRPSDQRRWAELHRDANEPERFVEVFADWCDDPTAEVRASDLLTLARQLADLGRDDEALERVHQAQLLAEEDPASWDLAAQLERRSGRTAEAIDALERGAQLRRGSAASERLCEAALLAESDDERRARELLRRAVEADSGASHAYARLAVLEEHLGDLSAAERAAARALDLDEASTDRAAASATSQPPLPDALRLACALAGGRAARLLERPEPANRFFSAALSLEPRHPESLAAQGELLFELGDYRAARDALEQRLALSDDPERASHLAKVGEALLRAGEAAEAAERFAQALAEDPAITLAHAGLVEIHEDAGRIGEAVEALARWAEQVSDDEERASCMLRAADLELASGNREAAEALLRSATETHPASERAWLSLLEQVTSRAEPNHADTLEVGTAALDHVTDARGRALLALVRAGALEADGQREAAAETFAEVLEMDAFSVEAALGRGRLQRDLGHFAEAATGFRDFIDAADASDAEVPGVALIHRELGRLMAGPLEDIQEAIRCYERAVALEPELGNVREPLASLLTHFPECWPDAVHHHRRLLIEDPARETSIRCLVRIAKESRAKGIEETGMAVLRALGSGAPRELENAPAALPKRVVLHERLDDETWERARRMLIDAAEDLAGGSKSGEANQGPEGSTSEDATAQDGAQPRPEADAFGRTVAAVRRRLTGAPFADLSGDEIAAAVKALVEVATGQARNETSSPRGQELDRTLSRRAHKRLRRTLHGAAAERMLEIDFDAWRAELRALATAVALDESERDLRVALISLLRSAAAREGEELDLCATGDMSARIAADPDAQALLRRVVVGWASELVGRV